VAHSALTTLGTAWAALLAVLAVAGVAGPSTERIAADAQRAQVVAAARPHTAARSGAARPRVPRSPAAPQIVRVQRAAAAAAPRPVLPEQSLYGCPMPDPSGSGGCITPAMGWLMAQVIRAFGDLPVSCWDPRDGDPYSDHPKGKACDYTFGRIGSYAGPSDVQRGWALALWLRANAVPLHVNYVIWQGRIWSRAHDAEGWRLYTGGGHYSTTGPTNGHFDHVHVSTRD
jgi:hypothetical protein